MNSPPRIDPDALASRLPHVAPHTLTLHNALHRPRQALTLPARPGSSAEPARLGLLGDQADIPREIACPLHIGDETLVVTTSWRALEALGAHPGRRRSLASVDAELAALWLEALWQPWLAPLEAALDCDIRLAPLAPPASAMDAPQGEAGDAPRGANHAGGTSTTHGVTLALAYTLDATTYPLALTLSASLAERLRPLFEARFPPCPAPARAVPMAANVNAGRQWLTLAEWRSLGPGDVVLLEPPYAEPDTLEFTVVDRCAAATLTAEGVRLLTPPRIPAGGYPAAHPAPRQRDQDIAVMTQPPVDSPRDDNAPQTGVDNFDSLAVTLTCEVGRLTLTLGELRELGQGSVLPLARRPERAVDLMVNGQRMGQGRLVMIGEDLGVQIERLALDTRSTDTQSPDTQSPDTQAFGTRAPDA
ncbi:type III secretion system cytoplasmic ring protein SctQ [Salinicola tamaricis]|uniref:type III secretion system cytoplasmic ring protein SctQ n=1 Tax=Salinicola tamaricis TaxID=1771309 RepID=UPI000D09EF3A|nr:type III secretion system cytoplasmic ring protein SctQ [Salinicola tamaricis]